MFRAVLAFALSLLLFASQALAGINVNAASQKELETLPGIGPAKATAIIEFRSSNGAFASLSDLDRVPGIGPATLANIGPMVEFGEGGAAAPAAASPSSSTSAPAPRAGAINVNTAGAKELERLPGIGPAKAAAIIGDRDANGPFASCNALTRVTGVGKATVASLAPMCTTD